MYIKIKNKQTCLVLFIFDSYLNGKEIFEFKLPARKTNLHFLQIWQHFFSNIAVYFIYLVQCLCKSSVIVAINKHATKKRKFKLLLKIQ